jgi:hypothetical protein
LLVPNSTYLANASGLTFISDGSNHAIEITAAGSYTFDNFTFTGYAGSDGSTGNEVVYNNSGGSVTINADSTFSVRNSGGSTTTIIAGAVPTTVTVVNTTGSPIQDARVFLRASNATGDLPFDDTVTISNSGTTATVTHTGHAMVTNDKVVISGASHLANNGVFTITKVDANSYTYTMGSAPGSNPTGTIKATWVALEGNTNAQGQVTMSKVYSIDQPVIGWARKSSGAPYYKTGSIVGTIDSATGASLSAVLILDQ